MSTEPWIAFRNEHGSLVSIELAEGDDGRPEPVVSVEPHKGDEKGYLSMSDMELCQSAALVLISGQIRSGHS